MLLKRRSPETRKMKTEDIEKEALRLPKQKRAELAERLLISLEDVSDENVEDAWLRAARVRAEELDAGAVKPISGEEMDRRVRELLRR